MIVVVDDVHVEDALAGHGLADVVQGLADCHLLVDGDELRRHDAARGRLAVLEELLDLLRFVGRHLVEDPGGLLLRQGLDDVGRLVGRHLIEDAGDLALVEHVHQGAAAAVVHFVENGARRLARELAEHGHLVGEVQLPERPREVGRVRVDHEGRELLPVAVPEPPADLLEEVAGVLDFHRRGLGTELGRRARGRRGRRTGPRRRPGAAAPLHEAGGQAGQRRGERPRRGRRDRDDRDGRGELPVEESDGDGVGILEGKDRDREQENRDDRQESLHRLGAEQILCA